MEAHDLTSYDSLSPDEQSLLEAAREAGKRARSDYYRFKVGSAVLTDDGHVFTSQNIEYSNGAADHAEEGALQAAANHGTSRIVKIAVCGSSVDTEEGDAVIPCGACLQRLSDWARWGGTEIVILGANGSLSKVKRRKIGDLLPEAFGSQLVKSKQKAN